MNGSIGLPPPPNGGTRPIPDPTVLTTEQLMREVASLRSYVDSQNLIQDERLNGIDKATALRISVIDGIVPQVEAKIAYERSLTDERLSSVQQQFRERDTRSERESRDNKLAVDAAFAAQEKQAAAAAKANAEAIGKSEAATKEAADKAEQLNARTAESLSDKIEDLKTRVGVLDVTVIGLVQHGAGGHQATTDNRATVAYIMAGVLFLVTIGSVILGVLSTTSGP